MHALNLLKKNLSSGSLNQSCLLVSADDEILNEALKLICDSLNVPTSQIIKILPESDGRGEISIGSIRSLKSELARSAIGGKRLVVVYSADKISTEAANSFLKTLEEPPRDTTIILLAESEQIIPTILSRCQKFYFPSIPKNNYFSEEEIEMFLQNRLQPAFKTVEKINERGEGDKFVDCLLGFYHQKLIDDQRYQKIVDALIRAKKYQDSNANQKLILENLVLDIIEG